jgi:hypothetical protein
MGSFHCSLPVRFLVRTSNPNSLSKCCFYLVFVIQPFFAIDGAGKRSLCNKTQIKNVRYHLGTRMSAPRDPSESSSGAKQVSFSDFVFVIGSRDDDAYDGGPPILQEILNDSDSTLSFSEVLLAKSDKFAECNEYSPAYSGEYDFADGLLSYPNLSFDDTSSSEESMLNDENSDGIIREYPDTPMISAARDINDENSNGSVDKPESGWASTLFSSFWYLSIIASLSTILSWLTNCFCSQPSVPMDHDDAAAAAAIASSGNKGFVVTTFAGDGGTTFIS